MAGFGCSEPEVPESPLDSRSIITGKKAWGFMYSLPPSFLFPSCIYISLMVNKNEALENLGTAAGRIDSNHLQALLNMQGNVAVPISGKVINVAHQIPYDCVLNRSSVGDMSTVDQLRLFAAASRRSRENSVASNGSASSSSLDSAPISHLAKRRSTLPALGESPSWRLSQRQGHSAMYAGIDSLKQNYRTLYVGSTGNIVSTVKDHIPADKVTEDERESLCQLLMSKHSVVPLFIDDHLAHGHYEGYCKQGKERQSQIMFGFVKETAS